MSNRRALVLKFGGDGADLIDQSIQNGIAADQRRGLESRHLLVDDPVAMRSCGADPVDNPGDTAAVKAAVDAIYRKFSPDYLVLVGSGDIIPHQDLINPLYDPDNPFGDPDETVPSDLPYACDAAYSRNVHAFTGPSRVVARIPDAEGEADPSLLVQLLNSEAEAETVRPFASPDFLIVSAEVWRRSTEFSLRGLVPPTSINCSPPEGPEWGSDTLARRVHFFNCHGALIDHRFYGESAVGDFPICHDSTGINGRITKGTLAVAECCYGASLQKTPDGLPSMAISYLRAGANAYFASTNVAYGASENSTYADVLSSTFMKKAVSGQSLGRAALEARQEFVERAPLLNPFHLKTLAQFTLLADPAVRLAPIHSPELLPKSTALRSYDRRTTRRLLAARGQKLSRSPAIAGVGIKGVPPARVAAWFEAEAARFGLMNSTIRTYPITNASPGRKSSSPPKVPSRMCIHILIGALPQNRKTGHGLMGIVANEANGDIIEVTSVISKGMAIDGGALRLREEQPNASMRSRNS